MPDAIVINIPRSTFPLKSFFEAKFSFNKRSGTQKLQWPTPPPNCLWNVPAPDFSLYKWEPLPPERNTRESMKPMRTKIVKQEKVNDDKKISESTDVHNKEKSPRLKFVRSMRPYTAKILFVRRGSFKPGPYIMPKPYDHRGLTPTNESKHPKFITAYERDPMNLNFLKRTRQQIWGTNCDNTVLRKLPNSFVKPLKQGEKWVKDLYLPKDPYPNREKCFTRHRLQFRDPHEVFLDRVTTQLQILWKNRNQTVPVARRNTFA
ncbi:unnamed protein product [Schistosoma turkestanicum]|nr:unnamed protein product [Schistosoma turkestanicum]